jgi:LCP family protein required for cell wall assembly
MSEPPRFESPPPKSRRRPILIGLLIVSLVLLGLAIGAYLQASGLVSQFRAGEKAEVVEATEPQLGVVAQEPLRGLRQAQTYLLLGSDARPGDTASRSDTTIVVRIYPDEKIASVLSIPRDLYVEIPGYGSDRINAAYAYGGVPLLTKTLREWLGVPVDHFFAVDFSSFAQVVDDLGGVYLPIDQDYFHVNDGQAENNWASIDVDHGYQRLDGEDALSWVRFRHLDSDFHRAARQQIFLREAGRQLREAGVGEYRDLAQTIAKGTTSDINLSEMLNLANTLRQIPAQRIVRVTMPGSGTMINGASVLLVSEEEKEATLDLWNNPEKVIDQQESRPPASQVERLNQAARALLVSTIAELDPAAEPGARRWEGELRAQESQKRTRVAKNKPEVVLEDNPAPVVDPGLPYCRPQELPPGYYWPEEAWRVYRLAGRLTGALYATQSSGVSLLWTFTSWRQAPILSAASDAEQIDGNRYQLYWDGGTLRAVSWKVPGGVAWVQNTLLNELDKDEMIGLATSCQ